MKAAVMGAAVVGLLAAGAVQAQEGPLLVRARVLNVSPDNGNSPNANVELSSKVIPEVDISYFFSKNLAAELILTYPQEHDVKAGGTKIGTLKELPPTLTVQYHFIPDGSVDPYVGVGLNYTLISDVKLPAGFDVDRSSVGYALQAGFDYKFDKKWSFNVDVKYLDIKTDVKLNGAKVTTLTVSPIVAGVGVGYRF